MSKPEDFKTKTKRRKGTLKVIAVFTVLAALVLGFFIFEFAGDELKPLKNASVEIENGIHMKTGFIEAEGLMTVITNCTVCHSSQLVIQNRMNKERWNATIKWMQKTQNLWDLGKNQEVIVNYLVENYPPTETGRRENLSEIDWYHLK